MDKAKRPAVIAGNWKMNNTPSQAAALIERLSPLVAQAGCQVVVCAPFVALPAAVSAAKGSNIRVGAQNMHFEPEGAFTGEISADMLKEVGVEYVILGHSERRRYFGETDVTVNKKLAAALGAGITPILCVGETLGQREEGLTEQTVTRQIRAAFDGIPPLCAARVVVAYEPVWAIGTGRTATAEQADEVCALIRQVAGQLYSPGLAGGLTLQYGGSMNAGNAAQLLSKYNIDGGLIGGASLNADDFSEIVAAASK